MKLRGDWLGSRATLTAMEMFSRAGKTALYVGGCVRNEVLGQPVNDIDIATDTLPQEVLELARVAGIKTFAPGLLHGSVGLVLFDTSIEVTTFRGDVETDGRHAKVVFTTRIEKDAARRDFTMNALYADRDGNVIDPLSGLPDLLARRVRFIGDARSRIREDYLRILRFFRIHALYGDQVAPLDAEGLAACKELSDGLERLSRERVTEEIRKLLEADCPLSAVTAMEETEILSRLLGDCDSRRLARLMEFEQELEVGSNWLRRLAALAGPGFRFMLRLSRAERNRLKILMKPEILRMAPLEAAYRYGESAALDLALVHAAAISRAPETGLFTEIDRGANARFPVSARDLSHAYSQRELGLKLKSLESKWIASRFSLTRNELLKCS